MNTNMLLLHKNYLQRKVDKIIPSKLSHFLGSESMSSAWYKFKVQFLMWTFKFIGKCSNQPLFNSRTLWKPSQVHLLFMCVSLTQHQFTCMWRAKRKVPPELHRLEIWCFTRIGSYSIVIFFFICSCFLLCLLMLYSWLISCFDFFLILFHPHFMIVQTYCYTR